MLVEKLRQESPAGAENLEADYAQMLEQDLEADQN